MKHWDMIVYLMRHGQTDWNKEYRLQGATDIPLNEEGRRQAKEAAEKMRDIPFECVYSSPLIRAKETAQIISAFHDIPTVVDDRLKEMSFGIYEGTTPDYEKQDINRVLLFEAPHRFVPQGGESF